GRPPGARRRRIRTPYAARSGSSRRWVRGRCPPVLPVSPLVNRLPQGGGLPGQCVPHALPWTPVRHPFSSTLAPVLRFKASVRLSGEWGRHVIRGSTGREGSDPHVDGPGDGGGGRAPATAERGHPA